MGLPYCNISQYAFWRIVAPLLTNRAEKNVVPGQLVSKKLADLDLYCFQTRIYLSLTQLTLNLIKTPFNNLANRADPDQATLLRAA